MKFDLNKSLHKSAKQYLKDVPVWWWLHAGTRDPFEVTLIPFPTVLLTSRESDEWAPLLGTELWSLFYTQNIWGLKGHMPTVNTAHTTTAKAHVTAREIPFKRRKQGTLLTQTLFWALPHWQPSSASFVHVFIFRAAVPPPTTRHTVLSFPSHFGYWLGSILLFPIAQQKQIRIFRRELR